MAPCIVFDPKDLLPGAWRSFMDQGPVRLFNPGLVRDGGGWILAYRVVGTDSVRRVALCRLGAQFEVVEGSPTAFTDGIRFGPSAGRSERTTNWFADPRVFRAVGRLWLYWNSGWQDPTNHQFVQEFDAGRLLPVGHPRELVLAGDRRTLEKNWMFLGDDASHAVYSVCPHRILEASWASDDRVECSEISSTPWDCDPFTAIYGELRGGAPPQRVGDGFFSICHAVNGSPGDYRYVAAAYRFSATAPFAPNAGPLVPLDLPNPFGGKRMHPKLNPAVGEVIYPCGASYDGAQWVISYGINDEHCAIAAIPHEAVLASLAGP